jgi:hypothetical protein
MSWGRHRLQEIRIRVPFNSSKFNNNFNFRSTNFNDFNDFNYFNDFNDFNHSSVNSPEFNNSDDILDILESDLDIKDVKNIQEIHEIQETHETVDSVYDNNDTTETRTSANPKTGRTLLQTQTDIKFAQTWLAGPFTWPPPFFDRLNSAGQCNLATAMIQIAHDLISVLVTYYFGSFVSAPDPPRRIWDNLPNLTCSTNMKPVPPADGLISSLYHTVWDILGINPGYVREFFSNEGTTNVFTISTSMLKCDFQAVTYCSSHRKDLLASVILILIFYVMLYFSANALGISFLVIVLIMASGFFPLLLWYSYGMAFTCYPMLPTCLLDDVIYTLSSLFPMQVTFPSELQTSPDCLGDSSKDSCLVRCSDPPVSFVEWRDTMAFGLCYTSRPICLSLAESIGERDTLSSKLTASAELLVHAETSRINASIFCFGVTFVNLIPVILLLVVGATVAAYLLYLPCAFAPKLVALLGQYLVYLHTKSIDD